MAVSGISLNEEKLQFQKLARDFSSAEISSKAEHYDNKPDFPSDLVHKAWELGLVNFQIPDECDGLGLDTLDACVILEELAAGCSGISGAIESSAIAILPVIKYGTLEQKAKFLKPLIESPSVAGYSSSLFSSTDESLTYRMEGKEYVLSGVQLQMYNGGHAAWYLVAAKDNKGKTLLFAVPNEIQGLNFGERLQLMGRKALSVRSTRFENVRVPASCAIKSVLDADSKMIETEASLILAAGATGVARCALELAIDYSKQRQTFGRPISQHQAVAFMMADMAREIETSRLLTWQAATLLDKDGDSSQIRSKALCARAFALEMVMKVTTDAVQVLGGYGYTKEYKVEKLMRDAKIYQVNGASSALAKVDLAFQFVSS